MLSRDACDPIENWARAGERQPETMKMASQQANTGAFFISANDCTD